MALYLSRVNSSRLHTIVTFVIALVWFVNGFFCKILNFVPRHEAIVTRILGENHASFFTKAIGVGEVLVTIWIVSGIKPRFAAVFQIAMVAVMNVIEFFLVPDLLLFGKINIIFASMFIVFVYCHEFVWRSRLQELPVDNQERA